MTFSAPMIATGSLGARLGFAVAMLLAPPLLLAADSTHSWTDSGSGFRAGTLGNSGQNLYINRRGELETIRHFDVDGDGNMDLLTNSGHDFEYDLPATLAVSEGGARLKSAPFGIDGSSRVIAADLNRDGFTDLLFMPNRHNIQYGRRSNLLIAWGGPGGWSTARVTRQLPIYGDFGAEDNLIPDARMAVGDLNQDGWPDILTLNDVRWMSSQPEGRIVRVYWGGPDGPIITHYSDVGVPNAVEIAIGHFGPKGGLSAAVLTTSGRIEYLAVDAKGATLHPDGDLQLPSAPAWAGSPKFTCATVQPAADGKGDVLWIGTSTDALVQVGPSGRAEDVHYLRARPATHIAVGRLDDDPWPDLVLTEFAGTLHSGKVAVPERGSVTILWGGPDGFARERSSPLAIPNAIATAVGDLNGDGHGDLVVSVHEGERNMHASSLAFFGDGGRRLPQAGVPIPTDGAQEVVVARPDAHSRPAAVFANSCSFTLDSAVPARLFWGSPQGFSAKSMTDLPNYGGLKSSLSDLNSDGYPDLILVNGGDMNDDMLIGATGVGANIYWGGPKGPIGHTGPARYDPARRDIIPGTNLCAINVADLNKDGYLDLVLGEYEHYKAGRIATELAIWYGSAEGFRPENRKTIPMHGRGETCLIADFDRDGWLDIALTHLYANEIVIYRGGPAGYSDGNKIVIPYVTAQGLDAADLNHDGWLDLLVGTYYDPATHSRDTGMSILWGGPKGYHTSNSQWLHAWAPDSIKIADLDGDGYLDIITPDYHGELNREDLASYIYWGSAQGYSLSNRTSLIVNSACDVMVGDFNRDGKLDLAFDAHSFNAGHYVDSPIFFNDGNRFRAPKVQYVPVIGPFYSWVQDAGNIYNRRYEENFESRVFTWTDPMTGGRLAVEAATPLGSHVELEVRSGPDEGSLASQPWRKASGGAFDLSPDQRAFQYKLALISANGDAYPIVRKVEVDLK